MISFAKQAFQINFNNFTCIKSSDRVKILTQKHYGIRTSQKFACFADLAIFCRDVSVLDMQGCFLSDKQRVFSEYHF